jgi:hypothetical protein
VSTDVCYSDSDRAACNNNGGDDDDDDGDYDDDGDNDDSDYDDDDSDYDDDSNKDEFNIAQILVYKVMITSLFLCSRKIVYFRHRQTFRVTPCCTT